MITVQLVQADPDWESASAAGKTALSAAERARLEAMMPESRPAFVTGRLTLRRMLADRLGVDPGDVRLHQTGAGRVVLSGAETTAFSVSHTGEGADATIAVAVSDQGPVGIDLERPSRALNWRRISSRHMHPDNHAYLMARPAHRAAAAFFAFWTLTEATVKKENGKLLPYLHALQIALPALDAETNCDDTATPRLIGATPGGATHVKYALRSLDEGRLMLALAYEGAEDICWDLMPKRI